VIKYILGIGELLIDRLLIYDGLTMRFSEVKLKKDPNYAPAYAGVSSVWTGRAHMAYTAPREADPKAKAAALKAETCEIYTDVDGVYTEFRGKGPSARKFSKISYDEMLEMAS
jgi:hypothetical protein